MLVSSQIEPVKNVYDMVDEEEYCRIVSERQLNDFVETDGAHTEYVDTGGEIFDDELDDESLANSQYHTSIPMPSHWCEYISCVTVISCLQ